MLLYLQQCGETMALFSPLGKVVLSKNTQCSFLAEVLVHSQKLHNFDKAVLQIWPGSILSGFCCTTDDQEPNINPKNVTEETPLYVPVHFPTCQASKSNYCIFNDLCANKAFCPLGSLFLYFLHGFFSLPLSLFLRWTCSLMGWSCLSCCLAAGQRWVITSCR